MPITVLLSYFIYNIHGGTADDLALIVSMSQAGMLLAGALLLLKSKWKHKSTIIMLALYFQVYWYFMQAITPTGWFLFMTIASFLYGATFPVTNTMFQTLFQTSVPLDMQGRINSIASAISGALCPSQCLAQDHS